jgi:hypothetical protein
MGPRACHGFCRPLISVFFGGRRALAHEQESFARSHPLRGPPYVARRVRVPGETGKKIILSFYLSLTDTKPQIAIRYSPANPLILLLCPQTPTRLPTGGLVRPSWSRAVIFGVFLQLNLPRTAGESNTVISRTLSIKVSCWSI